MRLAANLSLLWPDLPLLDRAQTARAAGFDGVEVLFPYAHSPDDWRAALAGLPLALINTPAGDWAGGERGFAAVPGVEARFRADFAQALTYARALGAGSVHVMAGNAQGPDAAATFRANLAWAAAQANGLPLTIEPLNPTDMPGYFLNDFDQAAEILADLWPAVGLQFDLWHAVRIHGDWGAVWRRVAPWVRHVQIAGFPSRGEPCAETLAFLARLAADGYAGWVAAEYLPAPGTPTGWITKARAALAAPAPIRQEGGLR